MILFHFLRLNEHLGNLLAEYLIGGSSMFHRFTLGVLDER